MTSLMTAVLTEQKVEMYNVYAKISLPKQNCPNKVETLSIRPRISKDPTTKMKNVAFFFLYFQLNSTPSNTIVSFLFSCPSLIGVLVVTCLNASSTICFQLFSLILSEFTKWERRGSSST